MTEIARIPQGSIPEVSAPRIADLLAHYDFEKLAKNYEARNWRWHVTDRKPGFIPDASQLREAAADLLAVSKQEGMLCSTGGLFAHYDGTHFFLNVNRELGGNGGKGFD